MACVVNRPDATRVHRRLGAKRCRVAEDGARLEPDPTRGSARRSPPASLAGAFPAPGGPAELEPTWHDGNPGTQRQTLPAHANNPGFMADMTDRAPTPKSDLRSRQKRRDQRAHPTPASARRPSRSAAYPAQGRLPSTPAQRPRVLACPSSCNGLSGGLDPGCQTPPQGWFLGGAGLLSEAPRQLDNLTGVRSQLPDAVATGLRGSHFQGVRFWMGPGTRVGPRPRSRPSRWCTSRIIRLIDYAVFFTSVRCSGTSSRFSMVI